VLGRGPNVLDRGCVSGAVTAARLEIGLAPTVRPGEQGFEHEAGRMVRIDPGPVKQLS